MPRFSQISRFLDFESGLSETKRSYNLFQGSMTSQCPAIRYRSRKIVKFVKIMAQMFSNCESMCDLIDIRASIYERKTAARPLTVQTTF